MVVAEAAHQREVVAGLVVEAVRKSKCFIRAMLLALVVADGAHRRQNLVTLSKRKCH